MSCAESSSTVRPSCSVRETVRRSSCCRTSNLFLKYSNFFLSMDDDSAAGPLPESFLSLSRTKMICAQIEMRQLPQRTHGVTGKQLSPKRTICERGSDYRGRGSGRL